MEPITSGAQFAKQFVLSDEIDDSEKQVVGDWQKFDVYGQHRLFCQEELLVSSSTNQHFTVFGLGELLDSRDWKSTNAQIVSSLSRLTSLDVLEEELNHIGGRWVLIVLQKSTNSIYCYHDATGQHAIYIKESSKGVSIATHPELLLHLGLVKKSAKWDEVKSSFKSCWPLGIVPYDGVKQLLPNHKYNLLEKKSSRYWPKSDIDKFTPEIAAKKMSKILSGLISASLQRHKGILSLTGGYDSRVILACSKAHWDELVFFTIKRDNSPSYDLSIPRKLARKFKLNHKIVDAVHHEISQEERDKLLVELQKNVGGMQLDRSKNTSHVTRSIVGERLFLPGLVSEVHRCYYYSDGIHPRNLTASEISLKAGFPPSLNVNEGFEKWLSEFPQSKGIDVLDLLYWEYRLGVWSSTSMTFRSPLINQLSPMNCREYLSIGLGVDSTMRRSPHMLLQMIIENNCKELRGIPFNSDLSNLAKKVLSKLPIPWRIKRALKLT